MDAASVGDGEHAWCTRFQEQSPVLMNKVIQAEASQLGNIAAELATEIELQSRVVRRGRCHFACCARQYTSSTLHGRKTARVQPRDVRTNLKAHGMPERKLSKTIATPAGIELGVSGAADQADKAKETNIHVIREQNDENCRLVAVRAAYRKMSSPSHRQGGTGVYRAAGLRSKDLSPSVAPGRAHRGYPGELGYEARVANRVAGAEGWAGELTT